MGGVATRPAIAGGKGGVKRARIPKKRSRWEEREEGREGSADVGGWQVRLRGLTDGAVRLGKRRYWGDGHGQVAGMAGGMEKGGGRRVREVKEAGGAVDVEVARGLAYVCRIPLF